MHIDTTILVPVVYTQDLYFIINYYYMHFTFIMYIFKKNIIQPPLGIPTATGSAVVSWLALSTPPISYLRKKNNKYVHKYNILVICIWSTETSHSYFYSLASSTLFRLLTEHCLHYRRMHARTVRTTMSWQLA